MRREPFLRRPAQVFVAHAPEDANLRKELSEHLDALVNDKHLICSFSRPGDDEHMNRIVAEAIERADVLLLLVSPSFLASRVCMDLDVPPIMARAAAGRAHVVPILARDGELSGTPFAGVQMRPVDGGPIASRADRDAAWREIVREVAAVAGAVHARGVLGEHGLGGGGLGSRPRRRARAPAVVEAPERREPACDALHGLLDGRTPRAQSLLMTAAVFAPAAVPLDWVMPAPEPAEEHVAARAALGELALLRLVAVDERAGTLSMRPSIRACVKHRASPEAWNDVASWAVRMVERWLARAGRDLVEARLPHLREVLALAQEMEDESAAAELYERFADHFRHSDTFSGCIGWPKARRSPGKDSRSANRLGAGPA